MENFTAQDIARELKLTPHPEGGFFKEIYRSDELIAPDALPERYETAKSLCTAIYYLITSDTFSAMHKLKSDEVLHYYMGASARIFMLSEETRNAEEIILGPDIIAGERPQVIVPENVWFGIRVHGSEDYTLTGTTVAPGFDFSDFEMADKEKLIPEFPEHSEMIKLFTH